MMENANAGLERHANSVPAASSIPQAKRNSVRFVELPACKMVTSGPINSPDAFVPGGIFGCFCGWISEFDKSRVDRFYPGNFMWSPSGGGFEWGNAVYEIPSDTGGFEVMDSPKGCTLLLILSMTTMNDPDGC